MNCVTFMDPDTPNFVFNNINAAIDWGLIIETEISEITPSPRVEEIEILGRSGSFHEWYGDYEPYTLKIPDVSIPYENIAEVKRWLRGPGKLITHNDSDKYLDVWCNMTEVEYENEWGVFYGFQIEFRCQPFKRKVNDNAIPLVVGTTQITDHGMEIAKPYFELYSLGGDVEITIKNKTITLLGTSEGVFFVDCETGKAMQNNKQLRSKGELPIIEPGNNIIILKGKIKSAKVWLRSVWL